MKVANLYSLCLLLFLLELIVRLPSANAQCGRFNGRPQRDREGNATDTISAGIDAVQRSPSALADLLQCWWQFRRVTDTSRFRFKVNWRHVILGAGTMRQGTPWRVMLEYEGDVASLDRIRGARLTDRYSTGDFRQTFLFEGLWRGTVDRLERPVIRFSYHFEHAVGGQTPSALRFTLYMMDQDIKSVFRSAVKKISVTSSEPTHDVMTSDGAGGADFEDVDSQIGLNLESGAAMENSTEESVAVQTTAYSVAKRRRTEAWIMVMCVLVGLSIGLILMATCVHPTRCMAFWRKRSRSTSSFDLKADCSPPPAQGTEGTPPARTLRASNDDSCYECNCKAGQYSRSAALHAESQLLAATAQRRHQLDIRKHGRRSLPETFPVNSHVWYDGEDIRASPLSAQVLDGHTARHHSDVGYVMSCHTTTRNSNHTNNLQLKREVAPIAAGAGSRCSTLDQRGVCTSAATVTHPQHSSVVLPAATRTNQTCAESSL